jgi:hypothetical protein
MFKLLPPSLFYRKVCMPCLPRRKRWPLAMVPVGGDGGKVGIKWLNT